MPVYYTIAGNTTVYSATYAPQRPGGKVYAIFADFGLVDDYAITTLLADSAAVSIITSEFAGIRKSEYRNLTRALVVFIRCLK